MALTFLEGTPSSPLKKNWNWHTNYDIYMKRCQMEPLLAGPAVARIDLGCAGPPKVDFLDPQSGLLDPHFP